MRRRPSSTLALQSLIYPSPPLHSLPCYWIYPPPFVARRVIAYATHGLFNNQCLARIHGSQGLSDVVVTNTVPLRDAVTNVHLGRKIAQLSVAPVLAEAMLRVQMGQSLATLRSSTAETVDDRYLGQLPEEPLTID